MAKILLIASLACILNYAIPATKMTIPQDRPPITNFDAKR